MQVRELLQGIIHNTAYSEVINENAVSLRTFLQALYNMLVLQLVFIVSKANFLPFWSHQVV